MPTRKRRKSTGRRILAVDHALAARILDWSVPLLVPPNQSPCWIWRGYSDSDGYAEIKYRGYKYRACRVSYAAFVATLNAGYEIDHTCGITSCVNPRHLEALLPDDHREREKKRYPAGTPKPKIEPLPF